MSQPERDVQGQVLSWTLNAVGEAPSRRLRALQDLSETADVFSHPHFLVGDASDTQAWIVTTNGGAGRVTFGPGGWVLDDGFGRHLYTFGVDLGALEALTLAARFLHVEVSPHPACSGCGCTEVWGCADGCTWEKPGQCSSCAEGERDL
jgi:hypothetical protein